MRKMCFCPTTVSTYSIESEILINISYSVSWTF
uniref:Uncharacterized protein n=1 Tax=Anguilla anguilla TaxID=7936 RepID=A0A0E9PQ78_ANGAN